MSIALSTLAALVWTAAPEGVELEEVVKVALSKAESPQIALARVHEADALVREAWAALLPTVSLAGTYNRRAFEVVVGEGEDEAVFQARNALFAQGQIQSTLFEARAIPDIGAAEDDAEAARAELERSRFELAHEVADAFVAVRVAEGTLQAAERRLEVARTDAEAAEERRSAGLIANADRDRADLEALEAEVTVTRAREAARLARLALGLLVGRDVDGELRAIRVEEPGTALTELVAEAYAARPELRAARAALSAARDRSLAPWLDVIPSLGVDAVVNATNEIGFLGEVFNWNIALTLDWTLYDGGLRYAEAHQAAAGLEIARLELSNLERTVRNEVREAIVGLDTARADVSLATRRVEVARRYADEVKIRVGRGLATAVEAADAAVSLFEAEVEAATVGAQLAQAVLRLRRSVGRWPTEGLASRGAPSATAAPG